MKYSTIKGLLYNSSVSATGNVDGNWSEVTTDNGDNGWVSSDYLNTTKEGE